MAALAVLRSCVMSRITIGMSRQLSVLESKSKRHAQGAEFLMSSATKLRPFSLPWCNRTIFNSLTPPVVEEFKLGSHIISLEIGFDENYRRSVLCHMDGTKVQSSIKVYPNNHEDDKVLQVRYDETVYCDRWISPNPTDREIICSALIGRSIRPLFTAGLSANIMVLSYVLKSNSKHDADFMAIIATSAALMISDITHAGPVGAIRIGRINGNVIVNPTREEQRTTDMNLLYVCTREKAIMIDLEALEISESDLAINLKLAHQEVVKCLDTQLKMREQYRENEELKMMTPVSTKLQDTGSTPTPSSEDDLEDVLDYFERQYCLEREYFEPEIAEEPVTHAWRGSVEASDIVKRKELCAMIKSEGYRFDQRHLHEIRYVHCEVGYSPSSHGSSLFLFGYTKVDSIVLISEHEDAKTNDSLAVLPKKRFNVVYNLWIYSRKTVKTPSTDITQGMLVEKALLAVIPSERDCPYIVRLYSYVRGSVGSPSMTSVCGGSIALMDAGVPLKCHVAGVSVGLVTDDEISKNRYLLIDTSDLEEDLGEMDLKIAGTRNGITAIGLDVKSCGVSLDIICEALSYGREARLQILDHMEQKISSPRGTRFNKKRKIGEKRDEPHDQVNCDAEVGELYECIVDSIGMKAAYVKYNGGRYGLLDFSELSNGEVSKVSDVLSVGKRITLKCIRISSDGIFEFSLKAVA